MSDSDRIAALETKLVDLEHELGRARARGEIENVFNRYMHLHNAFRDDLIPPLWVKPGTEGIRARYTNVGSYTTYESVMAYHTGRPAPQGKLITHLTTTPVIEVAGDGRTAKGVWLMNGIESGLTAPEQAAHQPDLLFSPHDVNGRKVWAHWVWCKYAIDFLQQDGAWRIWKFRCYELNRAPYERNWIEFAAENLEAFKMDLAYFGKNGQAVFLDPPDEPAETEYWPYSVDSSQTLEPVPPVPHATFEDTYR